MKAMVLHQTATVDKRPLRMERVSTPKPDPGEILVRVGACGVCHTELDEIEGRLPTKLPVIPGHQIVGTVERLGRDAARFEVGDRVGIAWIYSACGRCDLCSRGYPNLCGEFRGTGCDADGGYAEFTVVHEDFAYPIPQVFSDVQAAPLLCAGAIGYRALRLTGLDDGQTLGLFGFGASAHIVIQLVKHTFPNSLVFVFTRPGQTDHQQLATKLGADWVGQTGQAPPGPLHGAIDCTPAWRPVVEAVKVLDKAGRLVINAIRKEDRDKDALLELDYPTHLWMEKEIKTVANICPADAAEFLVLAAQIPILPEVEEFELKQANEALIRVKQGAVQGAAVLRISP